MFLYLLFVAVLVGWSAYFWAECERGFEVYGHSDLSDCHPYDLDEEERKYYCNLGICN